MQTAQEIQKATDLDLIEFMSWKEDCPEEAKAAFAEFCLRYDQEVLKKAEIFCNKWNYNEVVALDIAKCTFAKVWKYPTYDHSQSSAKNINKGIILWLSRIIFTQLANYYNSGTCFEPDAETDLSIVYTFDELIERKAETDHGKKQLTESLKIVESALSGLSEKHKIIWLTYKAYEQKGKNIPRCITEKLRLGLKLTQGSIRKYKEEANNTVLSYLKYKNG